MYTIPDASAAMSAPSEKSYSPVSAHVEIYAELYKEYLRLHDCFGRGENNVMKKLKLLKTEQGKTLT